MPGFYQDTLSKTVERAEKLQKQYENAIDRGQKKDEKEKLRTYLDKHPELGPARYRKYLGEDPIPRSLAP